jgi:hypothetical protein
VLAGQDALGILRKAEERCPGRPLVVDQRAPVVVRVPGRVILASAAETLRSCSARPVIGTSYRFTRSTDSLDDVARSRCDRMGWIAAMLALPFPRDVGTMMSGAGHWVVTHAPDEAA